MDRRERDGLVERLQRELGGRIQRSGDFGRGRALRRAMWPVYASAVQEHMGAHLSQAEAEQLVRLLSKLALP